MLCRLTVVLCGTAWAAAACWAGADPLEFRTAPGELSAALPDGTRAWSFHFGDGLRREVAHRDAATLELSDGHRLSTGGRLLQSLSPAAAGGFDRLASGVGVSWDAPASLAPVGDDLNSSLLFDSTGNGWAFIESDSLRVRRSTGHSGTWQAPETPCALSDMFIPRAVIDAQDSITVLFRSDYYRLFSLRYTPAQGWGTCQQIYSTPRFFQEIECGVDAHGNIPLVFDEEIGHLVPGLSSTFYDAATGTWAPPAQLSPPGCEVRLPTVVSNTRADAMYLVYLIWDGAPRGLYAQRWNSTTRTWGAATYLPGTEEASFVGAGPSTRMPGAVDANGDATVFWMDQGEWPHASRMINGVWQDAVLLAMAPITDMYSFASAATNAAGETAGILQLWIGEVTWTYVFRYRPHQGWLDPENPHNTAYPRWTRVRLALLPGQRAIATQLDCLAGMLQLVSLYHDGAAWAPAPLFVPLSEGSYFQELVADRGEALLVYRGEVGACGNPEGQDQGIRATFLRGGPGDLNCDRAVNFDDINPFVLAVSDPGEYATMYPTCTLRNGDIDGDGATDFADINPFVALLSGTAP